MVSLIQLRDTLALLGRVTAPRLSQQLGISEAMTLAMLEQLEGMGQVIRIDAATLADNCLSRQCRDCPESKKCLVPLWQLRQPDAS